MSFRPKPFSGSRRLTLLCCWLCASPWGVLSQDANNWFPNLFFGQNAPPPGVNTTVAVSAYLWRIYKVDEVNYSFSAQYRFTLKWRDPRAKDAIANATDRAKAQGICKRACSNINYPAGQAQGLPLYDDSVLCCDEVFLPTLVSDNTLAFEASTYNSRVTICDKTDAVLWTIKVTGTYYTAMDFRAFPFDTQSLSVHFRVPESKIYSDGVVKFQPSSAGISQRYQKGNEKGDDLSSFTVKGIKVLMYNVSWMELFRGAVPPSPEDPCPYDPANNVDLEHITDAYTSVTVEVQVQRYSWYFVWTILVPITLTGFMGFAIYYFDPADIATRFQAIVTLFLALMAVQFVVNANLPASSYALPTQQFIIATYVLFLTMTAESFLVYQIVETKTRREARKREKEAAKRFAQQAKVLKLWQQPSLGSVRQRKPAAGQQQQQQAGGTKLAPSGGGSTQLHAAISVPIPSDDSPAPTPFPLSPKRSEAAAVLNPQAPMSQPASARGWGTIRNDLADGALSRGTSTEVDGKPGAGREHPTDKDKDKNAAAHGGASSSDRACGHGPGQGARGLAGLDLGRLRSRLQSVTKARSSDEHESSSPAAATVRRRGSGDGVPSSTSGTGSGAPGRVASGPSGSRAKRWDTDAAEAGPSRANSATHHDHVAAPRFGICPFGLPPPKGSGGSVSGQGGTGSGYGGSMGYGRRAALRSMLKRRRSKQPDAEVEFFRWRAKRIDSVLGWLLFCAYFITGVLLFAIPYALYG